MITRGFASGRCIRSSYSYLDIFCLKERLLIREGGGLTNIRKMLALPCRFVAPNRIIGHEDMLEKQGRFF